MPPTMRWRNVSASPNEVTVYGSLGTGLFLPTNYDLASFAADYFCVTQRLSMDIAFSSFLAISNLKIIYN